MSRLVKLGRLASLGLVLLVAGNAHAAIQKCKSTTGEITYTQLACPANSAPVDLPDSVPEHTASSFRSSSSNSRYSSRNTWLDGMENRDLQSLYRECQSYRSRRLSECDVITEMWNARTRLLDEAAAVKREERRLQCEAGDKTQCEEFSCIQYKPTMLAKPYIPYSGSDAEVRGCSKLRRFPSSPQWAQIFETAENGMFVCLPRLDIRNEIGELLAFRAVLLVGPYRTAGGALGAGYTTPVLKGKVFPTMSEALNAGCQTLINNAPDWHIPAKPTAPKKI